MGEGFEHQRSPTSGGELIYSEGTHDLCCSRNPYESTAAGAEEAGGALHEERAEYGDEKNSHIYKVWGEEEIGRLRQSAGGSASADMRYSLAPAHHIPVKSDARERSAADRTVETSAGEPDAAASSATPVKSYAEEKVIGPAGEVPSADTDSAHTPDTPVKTHKCVFAVSMTESARFGTLWSVRVVHGETNYFALMRLMQKIEKRRASGEPLAANAPHQPKRRERSAAARLAFRYGIEEEDVYSIKFSSETVKRLAVFYGIPERDVRRIREEEVEEE
ncbi:MAG TPA: hypothetical protein VFJ67_01595 [Thermodesulfobacteriota bacterium]|nr:hypothetical protein [Thermodesulfobacteriota bacterium]